MSKFWSIVDEYHLTKFAIFIGGVVGGWAILEGVLPEPWHDKLLKVFLFLAFVLGFMLDPKKRKETINGTIVPKTTTDTITVNASDMPKPKL